MRFLIYFLAACAISCTAQTDLSKKNTLLQPSKNALSKQSASTLDVLLEKIKSSPSYENYISLGLEYTANNDTTAAISAYEKARDINPLAPLAWNNLCAEYNKQNKFATAITFCKKAIELEPLFQLAKNNLNHATISLAKTKKLLLQKKSELAHKKNLTSSEIVDLGLAFFNINEYNYAVDLWSKIKKGDSTDLGSKLFALAQNNLATVYIILKDFAKAEKYIEQALEVQPQNPLFLNNKKWLNESRKKN